MRQGHDNPQGRLSEHQLRLCTFESDQWVTKLLDHYLCDHGLVLFLDDPHALENAKPRRAHHDGQ